MEMSPRDPATDRELRQKSNIQTYITIFGAIFGFISVILLITTIALLQQGDSEETGSVSVDSTNSASSKTTLTLRDRFPGYFRTPEEQSVLEEQLRSLNHTIAPEGTSNVSSCTSIPDTEMTCKVDQDWVPIRMNENYHACCHSWGVYRSPRFFRSSRGTIRLMAKFDNQKQYFIFEHCETVPNCKLNCKCEIIQHIVTGVYDGGDGTYGIDWFATDGCCKCINT